MLRLRSSNAILNKNWQTLQYHPAFNQKPSPPCQTSNSRLTTLGLSSL
ncbi:Uncharacterised protein [Vibrio cholerae]|nr:Uncharacterised protein [Vibrio cholerae]